MDEVILTYYKEVTSITSSDGILKGGGDGQCMCFAELLWKAYFLSGLDPGVYGVVSSFGMEDPNILVKNWTFNQGSLARYWTHKFDLKDATKSEVVPGPDGIQGQGLTYPVAKAFSRHYIVFQRGRIFDPAYGLFEVGTDASNPLTNWEKRSLDGHVGTGLIENDKGEMEYTTAARKDDPSLPETATFPFPKTL